jgi:hypothetical protein
MGVKIDAVWVDFSMKRVEGMEIILENEEEQIE